MTVFIKVDGRLQPKVIDVGCDHLSMTMDVPIHYQKMVSDNIKGIGNYAPKGYYMVSGSIPLNKQYMPFGADKTGKSNVILQCNPKHKYNKNNLRFLRIEWNPNNVSSDEVAANLNLILPGGYDSIIKSGIVTRIDLSVDIAQAECDELLLIYPKSTITDVRSRTGRTEYIGGNKSPVCWCVYDKKAEIVSSNKKKASAMKVEPPNYSLTRFELRLKPKGIHLPELLKIKNPFAKLTVSAHKHVVDNGEITWELFLDSCRLRGAQAALLKIRNTSLYQPFKLRLKAGLVSWWNPNVIWSQYPAVIEQIANPFEYSDVVPG